MTDSILAAWACRGKTSWAECLHAGPARSSFAIENLTLALVTRSRHALVRYEAAEWARAGAPVHRRARARVVSSTNGPRSRTWSATPQLVVDGARPA